MTSEGDCMESCACVSEALGEVCMPPFSQGYCVLDSRCPLSATRPCTGAQLGSLSYSSFLAWTWPISQTAFHPAQLGQRRPEASEQSPTLTPGLTYFGCSPRAVS